ncbi:MAG TPA: prolyl oligopeptidase family serine peptidase [Vicinamibacterales bacterium]|nr:prolyl oligopeptidase family serine peptidase [Vicinamibacterales bacterium]
MKPNRFRLFVAIALISALPVLGPAAMEQDAAPKAGSKSLTVQDVVEWKTIGATALSKNGEWFAYRVAPQEGDAELVVRNVATGKETKYPLGETGAPAGGGGAAVFAGGSTLQFSDDSKWIAFTTNPPRAEAQRLRRQRRPVPSSTTIVNLANGDKKEYPNIRRFAFSGEAATHIALHRAPAQPAGGGAAASTPPPAPGGGRAGGPGGGAPNDRPRGTDLVLRELATGAELNFGNVSEFSFTRDGRLLAFVIDAADKIGNGVQLRNMTTGIVSSLDSDTARYERLTWTEKGDALTVLRGKEDRAYTDLLYSVVGFTGVGSGEPKKVVFDPSADKAFPQGFSISGNRAATWNEKLDAFVFGIHEPRKRTTPAGSPGAAPGAEAGDAPAQGGAQPPDDADEKVDLVLWHWKDPRLQSQQQVQENMDRNFSYTAMYHVGPQKFVRLADDEVRTVSLAPKHKYAIGFDEREYELMGNLNGQRFRDVYVIDPATGDRKLAIRRARWYSGASPDGESLLYYENGHFHVYSMKSGTSKNISQGAPVSFINVENDTNVVDPPTQTLGWTKDSKAVLISDNWDVWQVPVDGGRAVNLTANGRKDQVRYRTRYAFETAEEREDGIDLSKPQFFSAYGEWTKKGGIARLGPGKTGVTHVLWGDAAFGRVTKAEKADVVLYTRETALEPADYYATDLSFREPKRLTDMRPQVAAYNWTPGVQLVNYTCDKGDKLQAALYLPANYEKGKAYPTLVYFYERMSQTAHQFGTPTANGFNKSVYTSNGYAVLIPDIVFKVNDPGMSAVWCMVPAVKAAIATGIVDAKKVGITGHSWGGYQTSFLITQTDIFAAAVAGAPLTNMVSMYSLIYKNTGGGNMAIFESSQGRFKGGYWDNWDAYYRNSPVFFAKNVKTPLMILHNDKDGAVDFTQGVEYFNTLRRMGKPVIMLEYTGENHGLARRPNQRDYTVRMMEFFDHYLKGKPAPDWMVNGVPRLKMDEHLKERTKKPEPPKRITTEAAGSGGSVDR